jgi:hypothetical protein
MNNMNEVLIIWKGYIEKETLSTIVENIDNSDINKEIAIGEIKVNLKLKK